MPPQPRQRLARQRTDTAALAPHAKVVPIYGDAGFSGPLSQQQEVSTHVVAWNLSFCQNKRALASPWMRRWIEIAARMSGFSVMKEPDFLIFPHGAAGFPPGWTGHIVIGQSGIYFHTWPEAGWAIVLVVACGADGPMNALEMHLSRWFRPGVLTRAINTAMRPLP